MIKIKKYYTIILVGAMNVLHGGLHLIQIIQSLFLIKASNFGNKYFHQHSWVDDLTHNIYVNLLWFIIGIITLIIGIKDFIHHKKCNN